MSNVDSRAVAVVTGSGSGIGRAITTELASRGFIVVVTDIDEKAAEATAAAIGGESHALDVTDSVAARVIAEVLQWRTVRWRGGSRTRASLNEAFPGGKRGRPRVDASFITGEALAVNGGAYMD